MASGSLALTFKIRPWFVNQRSPFNSNFRGQQFVKPTNYQRGVPFQTPIFTMEENIQIFLLGNAFIVAKIIT
jgi:hypothetical protein